MWQTLLTGESWGASKEDPPEGKEPMFHELTYAAQAERAVELRREADRERLLRSARRSGAGRRSSGRRWLRAISGAPRRTARTA